METQSYRFSLNYANLDNYSTHGTAEVKAWLTKHPRFGALRPDQLQLAELIERWFATLTNSASPQVKSAAWGFQPCP